MGKVVKSKIKEGSFELPESFYSQVIENTGGVPFRLIFGSSLGAGHYQYIGNGVEKLFGIEPEKFTEKIFNSLVIQVFPLTPGIPADPEECRKKFIAGKFKSYKVDLHIRLKGGEERWVNDSSLPLRDPETGKIIGAQGILTDIGQRKNIEREREKNISLLRATLESTADGILVVDSAGKISDFNDRFASMWRIPESILRLRDDNETIMFVLDQLKYPDAFLSKVKELYGNPKSDSYDLLEFKDGRFFERFSHPQKIEGSTVGRVWSFRDITDRKRWEKSLQESEEQFRVLAEQSPNMIFINQAGAVVYANRKCEELMGYTRDEFLSPSFDFRSIVAVEYHGILREAFSKHMSGQEVPPYEYALVTRDGRVISSIITSKLITYRGERAILGIITDISERKEVENVIKENERFLRQIIDIVPHFIFAKDEESRFLLINKAVAEAYGTTVERAIGKRDSDFSASPEEAARFHQDDISIIRSGKSKFIPEEPITDASGQVRYLQTTKTPFRFSPTNVSGILGVSVDITERKRTEALLRESEEKYRNFVERANDGIAVIQDQKVVFVNRRLAQLWGGESEEVIGASFVKFLHPDEIPRITKLYQKRIAGEDVPVQYETILVNKEGEKVFVEINAGYFQYQGGPADLVLIRDITDRKYSERALKESEERYHSLFDRMMDGVYRSTHHGKFMDVNDAMVRMFGYSSKEEMLQVEIKKDLYFAPSDRDSLFLDTGQVKIEVFRMRRKDGSEIWVEDHGGYVHDENGNVIFHEGILRDVTDRLRNEVLQNAIFHISQGAEKAATLDDLFKTVHQIISTVMPAENFFIALYDEEQNLISFPYYVDKVDPPSAPKIFGKGLTEYVLSSGKPLLCDEATDAMLRKSGKVELVGVSSAIWLGVPLLIMGKSIGVMVVQHYSDPKAYSEQDLHMLEYVSSQIARAIEKKRDEDMLRRSEEQFRLISENVADLIAVLDLEGKRIYTSPSYKDILGDPQSLHGTDSFSEIHPEDRDRIKQVFNDTIKTGVGQRAEYRFVQKNGDIRYIESQGSVIKDKDGNITQMLVVSRDVTEKKKLEQQFLRSQRMESIGTLAGGIAHDLNNVLAPILLAIDSLRKSIQGNSNQQILNVLETSAHRGADIVKQVLAFARGIEGERHVLQPKHLIAEVAKIIKETFPRSIDIWTEIPRNIWTISADPTQIHQVLLNICVNARDAMPDGGNLTITARNTSLDEDSAKKLGESKIGPFVAVSISDTGTGIPSKILDKIFEPFFTTKEVGKGTGLGLSTVHAIVKSHGGFIHIDTEVNKGTKFTVYFPAMHEDSISLTDNLTPSLPQGEGEMILIVEDEASIREITKTTLEANGYEVITANDGADAISVYSKNKDSIRLVITDIMMPIMDGIALIRALQKISPDVMVIVATGLITDEVKKVESQVKALLIKPYDAESLLMTLGKILKKG